MPSERDCLDANMTLPVPSNTFVASRVDKTEPWLRPGVIASPFLHDSWEARYGAQKSKMPP